MSDDTTRLKLPLIAAQQAQKHVTHNEALLKLDVLVQATVLDRDLNAPPASPSEGDAYIVADGASGDWAGQEGNIAAWQNGGWVFHTPSEGWNVWVADEDVLCIHDGTDWIPFEGGGGLSLNPVTDGKLGINTTADNTNRLAVKSDAVLFSHDDVTPGSGDVQFKVNKAAAANTASLLFQDNWSGRAEMGLTGDDDFHIKVSADGNAWHEAMIVSAGTGDVTFGGIVSGDGSGLTNVDAAKLGGTPASGYAKLTGATFTGGVTATGFTGDGGGLTNVNAAYLGGKSPSSYALLSGADFTGDVSANSFSGDGSGLTNVDAAKLGGRPASDYALASDVPTAITMFTQLLDTPGSYSGQANKFVKVNTAGNALEFTDTKFTTLVDTPNSFAGQAGNVVRVNANANGLEFGPPGVQSVNPVPGGKLGINTTADDTNRLAVKSDAVLFSHDDVTPGSGDVRFKVNKKAAGNTASLLFQDNWSGRAEMGLAGDDDFHVKVSADGNTWLDSIIVKPSHNGKVMLRGLYIGDPAFYHHSTDLTHSLEIGGPSGSWTCNVQDGTGRVNYRWNASSGLSPVFQVSGDRAIEWDMDHNDMSCFTVRVSQPNPGAGNPVYWTELFRIAFTKVKASVPFQLPSYSKNALPSASSMGAGTMIYVHDDSAGPTVAFSDGTNWRRVHDRNVVA